MELMDICGLEEDNFWLARSSDGRLYSKTSHEWKPYEFNKIYQGHYKSCSFTALTRAGGMFCLAGMDAEKKPHFFYSLQGGAWDERELKAHQPGARVNQVTGIILRILYDENSLQYYLICQNGQLVTLPDCPKCLRIQNLEKQPVVDGVLQEKTILVSFADHNSMQIPLYDVAQYRSSLSYAREWMKKGALLVDLRSENEFKTSHLENAINVPLEKINKFLDEQNHGQRLFFICRIGIHADEETSYARHKGFSFAYSLGGMNMLTHIE